MAVVRPGVAYGLVSLRILLARHRGLVFRSTPILVLTIVGGLGTLERRQSKGPLLEMLHSRPNRRFLGDLCF